MHTRPRQINIFWHGGTTAEGNCSYLLPLSHCDVPHKTKTGVALSPLTLAYRHTGGYSLQVNNRKPSAMNNMDLNMITIHCTLHPFIEVFYIHTILLDRGHLGRISQVGLRDHNLNLVKIHVVITWAILMRSRHNFAHVTTAKLSWHVHICDLIGI